MQTCVLVNKWVKKQDKQQITLKDLAAIRHHSMAPKKHDSKEWDVRSDDRTSFCEKVVSRAEEITETLIRSQKWRHAFHDDRDSQVRHALQANGPLNDLKAEARKLIKNLRAFRHNENDPLLV